MTTFPTLKTKRLLLNRPTENDLEDLVAHMNSTPEISQNTLTIPFPYTEENAKAWLEMIAEGFEKKDAYIFGIRENVNLKLIGAIGIHINKNHNKAEIGYWLTKSLWNKGYVTEALQEILKFCFEELQLHKVYASHFPHNPASGKILQKCGMSQEAVLQQEIYKNGEYLDLVRFCILKK